MNKEIIRLKENGVAELSIPPEEYIEEVASLLEMGQEGDILEIAAEKFVDITLEAEGFDYNEILGYRLEEDGKVVTFNLDTGSHELQARLVKGLPLIGSWKSPLSGAEA